MRNFRNNWRTGDLRAWQADNGLFYTKKISICWRRRLFTNTSRERERQNCENGHTRDPPIRALKKVYVWWNTPNGLCLNDKTNKEKESYGKKQKSKGQDITSTSL